MLDYVPASWVIVPRVQTSGRDDLVTVSDSATAEDFLRGYKGNFVVMTHLREVLSPTEPVSRIDDDALIHLIAVRLAGGELALKNTGPSRKRKGKTAAGEQEEAVADQTKAAQVWNYSQRTGRLSLDGKQVAIGYSGTGKGKNNPDMEDQRDKGPIPRGKYRIGKARDTAKHGPLAMPLTPIGHNARGRSGFLIHGDNTRHDASTGCIVLSRDIREQIAKSGWDVLEVVP